MSKLPPSYNKAERNVIECDALAFVLSVKVVRKFLLWSEDETKGFLLKLHGEVKKKKEKQETDGLDLIANRIEKAYAQFLCSYPAHDQNMTFSV